MQKATKKAQKDAVRAILYAYAPGSEVCKVEHIDLLMNVFAKHPDWATKQGAGVASITVDLTGYGHGNRCFFLGRADGSKTDISFGQCIDGKSSVLSDVRAACRSAIHPTIMAYRSKSVIYGSTFCPISGEVLTRQNTHIDHYEGTFDEVFRGWIAGRDVDVLATWINHGTRDMETEIYFTNRFYVMDFVAYHNANTHLRAVSKTANLSTLRRK